jgi:5'-nucleotidase
MAITLQDKLVVAISSRALFDFEEENRLFEAGDDRAYMNLQLERLDVPAAGGVAMPLVKKLLSFNADSRHRVEVVLLSRNDPTSGMRAFRSAKHHGLPIERGVFTRGQRASIPSRGAWLSRIPTRCASPSTATPSCSRTKPSRCSKRRG